MDTLFHRLLNRAVSATVRVSSPLIAPIPITHSPTILRAVVTGRHVALWIALPAQGAPFPRNKVDGWGFDGKKKKREGGGFLEPGGWQVHFTAIVEAYFLTES